jgi:hypothetical protein
LRRQVNALMPRVDLPEALLVRLWQNGVNR